MPLRLLLRAVLAAALLAGVSPAPARATISPEAAKVVARYLQATGGAAAFAAESTVYTRAKVSGFGFTGSFESWSARPSRHLSRTALGPFSLAEGDDGTTAWRTDPTTGRIVKLADQDLAESRLSTWFEMERWAEPDQGGGKVEVASHEKDSTGTSTVLSVQGPNAGGAKPRRLWFADATGLITRSESPHDQTWVTTTLSDWRTMAGRKRPFVTLTSVANMPANQLRQDVDSIASNISVAALAFAPPDSGGGNVLHWLHTDGTATLPFEYRARHVWLKASLDGGPPQDFLFDTGASVSILDSTFAATHGIPTNGRMQAAGAGASGSATFTTIGALKIAGADGDGVELRALKVAVLSVNPQFARFFWRDMAGIIGYDIISRFVTEIDYDKGQLVLHDPRTWHYSGQERPLPMVMNGIVPAVQGTLDGHYTGLFRLDVGSSSTVDLHTPFVVAHQLEKKLRHGIDVAGAGFGGDFSSRLGRLHRMAIGPYHWDDPMVTLTHATEGAFTSEDFAGNIGNRLLERFRVTLDYEHRQVILEPGRRYTSRDSFTRSGVLFGWFGDHVEVMSVLPDSPAEHAGLRAGDHVTAIDGRAIADWDEARLDESLEAGPDGRLVPVAITRGGEASTVTMKLQEMLP